jgi:hypothetical protein
MRFLSSLNLVRAAAFCACVAALLGLAGCFGPATSTPTSPSGPLAESVGEVPSAPRTLPAGNGEKPLTDEPGNALALEENEKGAVKRTAVASEEKQRDPLFKNWPKPKAALVLTGLQSGYIEPCGCTGLANQKGGLARRHSFFKQLAGEGWPLVPLDVGNQVRRFGRQPEIKFQMTVEGLKKMGYQAVGFGPEDLQLSTGELVAAAASAGAEESLFVSCNIAVLDPDLFPRYKVITAGGKKIGVTTVLGTDAAKRVLGDEIIKQPALEGLAAVWPKLSAEKCDLYVLLAHASLDESKALAGKFPEFDVVVSSGGAGEPTLEPEKIPSTKAVLVQVGTKGMYVGVVGLFDDSGPKIRYQRVPLDDRHADSKDMLALLASYQDQLKSAGLEGLGLKPLPHPSGRSFVGSETCGECHTKAYDVWKKSPHAKATESLVHPGERSEIARHFDPECLSCHVTGWNPQKFYPYKSGYLSLADKALHGNGCENCHGPGSRHVAAEQDGKNAELLKMLRASMRQPLAKAETQCMECHDLDNSPDFHAKGAFEKYWKDIEHKGVD